MGKKRIHKGKLLAFVGMAVISLSAVLFISQTKAQNVTTAPSSHIECRAPLDYPNSNGYVESYTRSNPCHQTKVFYNYGDYFQNSDNVRVRCPAGATVQTHNSGGGWHYPMSPNISGAYDGPAHHFCVDASGNQVEAEIVDVTPPAISAVNASNVTQTGAVITWTTNENADSQVEYGTTANYGSATTLDATMVASHTVNLTGLTAGTTYNYRVKSKDAAGNASSYTSTFSTAAAQAVPPGSGAPEPTNNESGVWAQVDILTSQIVGTAVCTRSVCGLNGEYHGYVPPPTFATGSVWWPTSKRYIWQMQGQAGYSSGIFDFNAYVFTVSGGTIYNGQFTPTTTVTGTTTPTGMTLTGTIFKDGQYIDPATSAMRTCISPNGWMKEGPLASGARGFHCMLNYTPTATDNPPTSCVGTLYTTGTSGSFTTDYCSTTAPGVTTPPTTPPTTTPVSCGAGEKCASGSWCNNGQKCFYPDSQITCAAWPPPGSGAMSVSCPSGTSVCDPSDTNCVAPGQTIPYTSGKWCSQSQSYYSVDGKNMACVAWGGSAPSGYSVCRPDDRSCIPENSYGPYSGSCYNSMKCYQKATDSDANNDVYCTKNPSMTSTSPYPEPSSCPSGYGSCSPTDTNCKEKGETWTDSNSSYNCMGAQKCVNPAGGGSCVGWNESCPAGTKYCDTTSEYCVEPGEYKILQPSSSSPTQMGNNYWCGGGGMVFYSSTKVYCEKKAGSASGSMGMMWTGEEVKAVLNKLGSGWGLCSSSNSNCIEPGKTGPSTGWCTWYPPGSGGYTESLNSSIRTCPALDGSQPKPPKEPVPPGPIPPKPPVPPGPPEQRECNPGEMPSMSNTCMMPMYRWVYADKKFEKCPRFTDPRIMSTVAAPMRPGTNCQSMNYDLEAGWRTKRYLVHPPEKDGEWYMPPWDATQDRLQYSPDKDALEECSAKDSAYLTKMMPLPDTWIGPCQPVPPEDKEWMLDMYRSQYKMFLMYKDQWKKPGPNPEPTPLPIPVPLPDPGQCKPYLNNVRQGLVGDKQFWKDVNRKLNEVKGNYAEADKVSELLAQAKDLIVAVDKATKKGGCSKESLGKIQDNLDTLHTEIFSELSAHLTDMEELGQFARCRTRLEQLGEEAAMFVKKAENDEDQEVLKDLVAQIAEKADEFGKSGEEDFEFDATFGCETFVGEIEEQLIRFRRYLNEDTSRISDAIVEKFGAHIKILTQDLSQKQKQIDELIVQVAELKKTAESLTQAAKDVSDKLVTSYTALAQMGEKFEEDRRQILAEKDRLVTLVEEAMGAIKETGCVRVAVDRDRMVNELGQVATVNWTPSRGEQLEKRLQLIIDSCRAKDFTREDMNGFFAGLDEAELANMTESYRRGYTPFADVPTHEWYYGGMTHAYENGYMTKGMPGESALAQDALLMVLRAAGAGANGITGDCALNASQVSIVSPYAVCAVNYAHEKGLPLQSNMTLPVERIRIAQWITLLKPDLPKRADDAVDFDSFMDIQSLGDDTQFVAYMYSNGIMVGRVEADGKTRYFEPHVSLTRAALAVILDQLRRVSGEPETH